ncbi:hypothetical protein [Variovorax gossypii]|jgi:hypothetical protein|uniref:hypothetical protein n=1 Tax=uncultured Variovorax sp. TaxID=114708 RepID=UPI002636683B|nr:hypothetical protein [uncultured Variovorax sp.]
MGYDARVSFEVAVRAGVTRAMVEQALRPLLDEAGTTLRVTEDPTASKMIALDSLSGLIIVSVEVNASWNFRSEIFEPVVLAVGELAATPFEATLEDQDTGDADERYFTMLEGPPGLLPEYKARAARAALLLDDIVLPPGARGWPMEDLTTRECMSIATIGAGETTRDAVTRVSVDLVGLDIDLARRERIARLTVLLAREVAGDELVLYPLPGYGAAERAIDAIGEIRNTIDRHEQALGGGGADHRAPDGSDYVALTEKLIQQTDRVRKEFVALSNSRYEPQAPDQPDAPRG